MDLLGSILDKMDNPPSRAIDEKEQKKLKALKEKAEKQKEEEREIKMKFREKTEKEISDFINNLDMKKLKFHFLDKVQRSIVHDISEVAGLTSFSFGEEDVDRFIILWKKEFAPSDIELDAYRNGDDYDNPDVAERLHADAVTKERSQAIEASSCKVKSSSNIAVAESATYFEKYEKILGNDSGIKAAKTTGTNASYGMVPSENKKDQRSIEETLNEIRARKRQKLSDEAE